VCATNVGAANGILEKMSFDTILMDEAAQATEPMTLIPIVRAGVCRVILVGDHKQLPPTVLSKRAVSEGFSQSLFERLVAMQVQPYVLSVQYRMHPAIAAYPSTVFYHGQIHSGIDAEDRQPPSGFQWPSMEVPIAFCHVPGSEEKRGNSYVNLAEGLKVESVLQALLQPGDLQQHDIGIISPYTSQVLNIKQRVQAITKGRRDGPVEVASIDGFQGREKEVIIVSTTRANKEGNLGFVKDFRRMNVTLTRA
jgi:superfamily I DNA and/or RNA helicase